MTVDEAGNNEVAGVPNDRCCWVVGTDCRKWADGANRFAGYNDSAVVDHPPIGINGDNRAAQKRLLASISCRLRTTDVEKGRNVSNRVTDDLCLLDIVGQTNPCPGSGVGHADAVGTGAGANNQSRCGDSAAVHDCWAVTTKVARPGAKLLMDGYCTVPNHPHVRTPIARGSPLRPKTTVSVQSIVASP